MGRDVGSHSFRRDIDSLEARTAKLEHSPGGGASLTVADGSTTIEDVMTLLLGSGLKVEENDPGQAVLVATGSGEGAEGFNLRIFTERGSGADISEVGTINIGRGLELSELEPGLVCIRTELDLLEPLIVTDGEITEEDTAKLIFGAGISVVQLGEGQVEVSLNQAPLLTVTNPAEDQAVTDVNRLVIGDRIAITEPEPGVARLDGAAPDAQILSLGHAFVDPAGIDLNNDPSNEANRAIGLDFVTNQNLMAGATLDCGLSVYTSAEAEFETMMELIVSNEDHTGVETVLAAKKVKLLPGEMVRLNLDVLLPAEGIAGVPTPDENGEINWHVDVVLNAGGSEGPGEGQVIHVAPEPQPSSSYLIARPY